MGGVILFRRSEMTWIAIILVGAIGFIFVAYMTRWAIKSALPTNQAKRPDRPMLDTASRGEVAKLDLDLSKLASRVTDLERNQQHEKTEPAQSKTESRPRRTLADTIDRAVIAGVTQQIMNNGRLSLNEGDISKEIPCRHSVFRVGDAVKCVKTSRNFTKGRFYTIQKIFSKCRNKNGHCRPIIGVVGNNGYRVMVLASNFEPFRNIEDGFRPGHLVVLGGKTGRYTKHAGRPDIYAGLVSSITQVFNNETRGDRKGSDSWPDYLKKHQAASYDANICGPKGCTCEPKLGINKEV